MNISLMCIILLTLIYSISGSCSAEPSRRSMSYERREMKKIVQELIGVDDEESHCNHRPTTSNGNANTVLQNEEMQTALDAQEPEMFTKEQFMKVKMVMQEEILELKRQLQEARELKSVTRVKGQFYSRDELKGIFKSIFTETQLDAILDKNNLVIGLMKTLHWLSLHEVSAPSVTNI